MQLLVCADGAVGNRISDWLLAHHPEDVVLGVTTSDNELCQKFKDHGIATSSGETEEELVSRISNLKSKPDLGLLAWWPRIVKPRLLNTTELGFINTHPSLLPYNRGKHYNFWALVEEAPFGVTLHMVEAGIDCGDIVAQLPLPYSWEDSGETLYHRAADAMYSLFVNEYPRIRELKLNRVPQDLSKGSFHLSSELNDASCIELDRKYTARELLNLLRARTFDGHPSCWFEDDSERFEVRIRIEKVESQ